MANWKEIKRRIKSIKNTWKITKAMELISTVKMKKAQDTATEKKAYITAMQEVFLTIWESFEDSKFFQKNWTWKTLWIIITSNKWLCWGYNINVMKKVNSYIKENPSQEIDFVTVWKRWTQFIARTWNHIIADFSQDFSDNINLNFSKSISKMVQEKFLSKDYSQVVVFYSHFINTIKQVPVAHQLLPLNKSWIEQYFKQVHPENLQEENKSQKIERRNDFSIEPSKKEILKQLIPMLIDSMFFDTLLESKASEHSSRMIAMKNAKDNANKYASKLTLAYNKARQASITKEVSEIVSWVESMKE